MAMKFEKISEGSYELDVLGYVCPHPQIYTKKVLEKLQTGDELEILFDNPSSAESISSLIEINGDEIKDQIKEDGKYRWTILKA